MRNRRKPRQDPLQVAKLAMTEAAEALLAADPDRVQKAERALKLLREAERPRRGGR